MNHTSFNPKELLLYCCSSNLADSICVPWFTQSSNLQVDWLKGIAQWIKHLPGTQAAGVLLSSRVPPPCALSLSQCLSQSDGEQVLKQILSYSRLCQKKQKLIIFYLNASKISQVRTNFNSLSAKGSPSIRLYKSRSRSYKHILE